MNDLELLEEWIEKLRKSHKLIIVEGKKDRKALEELGINSERIFTLNKSKALIFVAEETSKKNNKIILLTDLDKKGKEIYGKLSSELQKNGAEIDNYFREFLFKNTKLRQIEGISTHMKKIREKEYEKNAK